MATQPDIRHDWTLTQAKAVYDQPLNDLLLQAQLLHRQYFSANEVQISTLLSIKTGGCPEDCKYCPQSAHFDTGVKAEKLMGHDEIVAAAKSAKEAGATRFCMGAAWRSPKERDMPKLAAMIGEVKALGLETCATLGMVTQAQAEQLKAAGLDFYNHNIDTSEAFYQEIITTRSFDDRLQTLEHVRAAGMQVCCGGIIGMGESEQDRLSMLTTLATQPQHPQSVPINLLIRIPGTPMEHLPEVDPLEMVRLIATARILMPASHVRLSAGREDMSDETQALCFMAGANSIFYGETLLTAANPQTEKDRALMAKLGLRPEPAQEHSAQAA